MRRVSNETLALYFDGENGGSDQAEMAAELIERRAWDLTDEEREALEFARYRLVEYPPESGSYVVRTKRALAALDKLLGGKP